MMYLIDVRWWLGPKDHSLHLSAIFQVRFSLHVHSLHAFGTGRHHIAFLIFFLFFIFFPIRPMEEASRHIATALFSLRHHVLHLHRGRIVVLVPFLMDRYTRTLSCMCLKRNTAVRGLHHTLESHCNVVLSFCVTSPFSWCLGIAKVQFVINKNWCHDAERLFPQEGTVLPNRHKFSLKHYHKPIQYEMREQTSPKRNVILSSQPQTHCTFAGHTLSLKSEQE